MEVHPHAELYFCELYISKIHERSRGSFAKVFFGTYLALSILCYSNGHGTNLRAANVNGIDPMGSTDTMTASEVSTNITLDTVSSHTCSSGSQMASCRGNCGSLASFDTNSIANIEGINSIWGERYDVFIATHRITLNLSD